MSLSRPLFGLETEYALTGLSGDSGLDRAQLVNSVMSVARQQCVHLPDVSGHGMYLSNGCRFYIDCGHHPEMATPECTNPWDVVRYVKAGERILSNVTSTLEARSGRGTRVLFFLCNVDYSGSATWGCHESYLCRTDTRVLAPQIIPHLVTRVIYTGAGGFEPLSEGIEFSLFPRAAFFRHVVSSSSTEERGIIHTRDEPLACSGYRRLHLICGESLCSELAIWLKVGATALVVAMADRGLKPGASVQLAEPLEALRAVASDPECRRPLDLTDRRRLTAIEIQRQYLELAVSHLESPWMPSWGREVCDRWRRTLDELENGPDGARTRLDWAIKLALYRDYARRNGVAWDSLGGWSEVLSVLKSALESSGLTCRPIRPGRFLEPNSPAIEQAARITRFLGSRGKSWGAVEQYDSLKRKLQEVDVRFGQLGGDGIFHALDAAGQLEHRVTEPEGTVRAMTDPPAEGRAQLRGAAIRQFAGDRRHQCDWQGVWDLAGHKVLDLSEPFPEGDGPIEAAHRSRTRVVERRLPFPPPEGEPDEPF